MREARAARSLAFSVRGLPALGLRVEFGIGFRVWGLGCRV